MRREFHQRPQQPRLFIKHLGKADARELAHFYRRRASAVNMWVFCRARPEEFRAWRSRPPDKAPVRQELGKARLRAGRQAIDEGGLGPCSKRSPWQDKTGSADWLESLQFASDLRIRGKH